MCPKARRLFLLKKKRKANLNKTMYGPHSKVYRASLNQYSHRCPRSKLLLIREDQMEEILERPTTTRNHPSNPVIVAVQIVPRLDRTVTTVISVVE